jgi:hypothetical protein
MDERLARLAALRLGLTDEELAEQRVRKLAAEALGGVTLEQYATVCAARADALPIEAALAAAGVDPALWATADKLWDRRLQADLAGEGHVAEALEVEKGRALLRWRRPLPPLDVDLRAWLDFERAYMLETNDAAFLEAREMRRIDLLRLHAIWRGRLEDATLRAEAAAILAEPPGDCPVVAAEPAALPHGPGAGASGRTA